MSLSMPGSSGKVAVARALIETDGSSSRNGTIGHCEFILREREGGRTRGERKGGIKGCKVKMGIIRSVRASPGMDRG
jgi:hypothetical protein